jgi:hypothetical protein
MTTESKEKLVTQEKPRDFLFRRATGALPQVEVLACHLQARDWYFFLHLRDPFSKAELVLPISGLWVDECRVAGDCSSLNQAFESAAEILNFKPPQVSQRN